MELPVFPDYYSSAIRRLIIERLDANINGTIYSPPPELSKMIATVSKSWAELEEQVDTCYTWQKNIIERQVSHDLDLLKLQNDFKRRIKQLKALCNIVLKHRPDAIEFSNILFSECTQLSTFRHQVMHGHFCVGESEGGYVIYMVNMTNTNKRKRVVYSKNQLNNKILRLQECKLKLEWLNLLIDYEAKTFHNKSP